MPSMAPTKEIDGTFTTEVTLLGSEVKTLFKHIQNYNQEIGGTPSFWILSIHMHNHKVYCLFIIS
eukprot:UN01675